MIKYYLIKNKLLVKGDVLSPKGVLVENAFVYRDGNWQEVNPYIINDRIIGLMTVFSVWEMLKLWMNFRK